MNPASTTQMFLDALNHAKEEGVKQAIAMLKTIGAGVWHQFWPYIIGFAIIVIGGVILQILMIKAGGHNNRLSGGFNSLVESLVYGIFFLILLFIAYKIWGAEVIDEDWFGVIGAISFPLTWLFLKGIGFWYY